LIELDGAMGIARAAIAASVPGKTSHPLCNELRVERRTTIARCARLQFLHEIGADTRPNGGALSQIIAA
jgi:hypothetical protein